MFVTKNIKGYKCVISFYPQSLEHPEIASKNVPLTFSAVVYDNPQNTDIFFFENWYMHSTRLIR